MCRFIMKSTVLALILFFNISHAVSAEVITVDPTKVGCFAAADVPGQGVMDQGKIDPNSSNYRDLILPYAIALDAGKPVVDGLILREVDDVIAVKWIDNGNMFSCPKGYRELEFSVGKGIGTCYLNAKEKLASYFWPPLVNGANEKQTLKMREFSKNQVRAVHKRKRLKIDTTTFATTLE